MRERTTTPRAKGAGTELMNVIGQIGREKGIDLEILVGALEDAVTIAARKHQERSATVASSGSVENLVSRLNRETGELELYARKRVVESATDPLLEVTLAEAYRVNAGAELGSYVDLPRPSRGLGRVEAQAAKQVIFQKVREAEREIVYNEYRVRVGELVHGTVKRFERADIVLEVGRTEALLPRRFQSPLEVFSQGDRIRAIVVEVVKSSLKGPQILVSRTDALLVVKLFETEVPEVYDGTITLCRVVREPGERAKVAVTSRDPAIDPVGACVGVKGARVQAIIRELRGEKIDIEQWSEDLTTFAANALKPAKVGRVATSPLAERTLQAVIDDSQLSLAIGKKGQNVRLASRLVGWRIDIRGEEEQRRQAETQMTSLVRRATRLSTLPRSAEDWSRLEQVGVVTVEDLLHTPPVMLASLASISQPEALRLRQAAEEFLHEAPGATREATPGSLTGETPRVTASEPPAEA